MQRKLSILFCLVLAWTMIVNPAAACNCGRGGGGGGGGYYGGGGGGYYSSGYSPSYSSGYGSSGYGGSYASYYPANCGGYSSYYGGGGYGWDSGCSSCGYESYGWSDCGGCSSCSSCYSDCGGCSDCGSSCSSCGGCSGSVSEEGTVEGSTVYGEPSPSMEMPSSQPAVKMAPQAPVQNQMPSTVKKQPMPPQSGPQIDTKNSRVETMPLEKAPAMPPQSHNTYSKPAPAAAPADSGDLFGPPADNKMEKPSTPPQSGDLFGPAESGPSGVAPAGKSAAPPAGDDLFAPPAEEPAKAAPGKAEEDDLFKGSSNVLSIPGGLASNGLRRWVDNTGDFSCRGRLLRVMDGKVQILKDNGKTTTVSMDRLSPSDAQFVNLQASAQRADAISKTAQLTH